MIKKKSFCCAFTEAELEKNIYIDVYQFVSQAAKNVTGGL